VNPSIEGYLDALLEGASDDEVRAMAEQTAAVADLVSGNRQLRSALTDTAITPRARRAVTDELLRDRVSDLTRRAVGYGVFAAPAPEVVEVLSWVALEVSRAAAGRRDEPLLLGRTASRRRIGGYASALNEELSAGDLEEMEDALFRFARTVEATAPLRNALTNPDLPSSLRRQVVGDLIAQKVSPATLRLIDYVVSAGRPRDIVGTLEWLVDETAAARGWRVARVKSARDIDEAQQRRLSESLGRVAGAPVDLEVTIDPELIGGAVVQIGDLQVDASARGRLERLREHLQPGGWDESRVGAPHRGARAEPDGSGPEGARG
jgi:F-type H+-transporting ATPase subunit delta